MEAGGYSAASRRGTRSSGRNTARSKAWLAFLARRMSLTFTDRFSSVADRYDVVLCDVWGVVHNSLVASPEAHDALSRFRARGNGAI